MKKTLLVICALTSVSQVAVANRDYDNYTDSYYTAPVRPVSPTLKAMNTVSSFKSLENADCSESVKKSHANALAAQTAKLSKSNSGYFSRFCSACNSITTTIKKVVLSWFSVK